MRSDSPHTLAQILKTTLYLFEKRKDLDQQSPSVTSLKESMRKTIDQLEKKIAGGEINEPGPQLRQLHWTDAFRKKWRNS